MALASSLIGGDRRRREKVKQTPKQIGHSLRHLSLRKHQSFENLYDETRKWEPSSLLNCPKLVLDTHFDQADHSSYNSSFLRKTSQQLCLQHSKILKSHQVSSNSNSNSYQPVTVLHSSKSVLVDMPYLNHIDIPKDQDSFTQNSLGSMIKPSVYSTAWSRNVNVMSLLQFAASDPAGSGILIYNPTGINLDNYKYFDYPSYGNRTVMSYKSLWNNARINGDAIDGLSHLCKTKMFLLHTDNHLEATHWFWSILAVARIPCISTPFSKDPEQRKKHIRRLVDLLDNPVIITSDRQLHEFEDISDLQIWTFSQIDKQRNFLSKSCTTFGQCLAATWVRKPEDIAVMMLTSGSSGDAKIVPLKHGQLIESIKGKIKMHGTRQNDVFFNWIGLDHVAHLVEIHLHAMALKANQISAPTSDIAGDPELFLKMASYYEVTYTFAPNFFLGLLVNNKASIQSKFSHGVLAPQSIKPVGRLGYLRLLEKDPVFNEYSIIDLSCLRSLISGGEPNVVETCDSLTRLLQEFGAPYSFICPGFGMTETCAGSIYSIQICPEYDIKYGSKFACLGASICGLKARIEVDTSELQVSGPVVFGGYWKENVQCWTNDGWFKTGDKGIVDRNGRLHLLGREKDVVIVNGINHHPKAIENAIEQANIPGLAPTYTIVFAHRPISSDTETIVVVYLPTADETTSRIDTAEAISKATVLYCGIRPYRTIPLGLNILQKSSLGKISRSKIQKAFEEGLYDKYQEAKETIISMYNEEMYHAPTTIVEEIVIKTYLEISVETNPADLRIGTRHDLFKLGLNSIELLRLRSNLQSALNIPHIPLPVIFSHSIIADLANHLSILKQPSRLTQSPLSASSRLSEYNPVVILQSSGHKTPIWLIHPGVGEVLIFLPLSKLLSAAGHPVYALRARGFDRNQKFFSSMDEMISTYYQGIKTVQPAGPYAIAGYSFGSVLGFEIAKAMERQGDEVKFLATFDQAPFFKTRAKSYDWYECVLTISFFLGLLGEDYAYSILPTIRAEQRSTKEVLHHIFALAPADRLAATDMTPEKLNNWANLALQLKKVAAEWDPSGKVSKMDVFYTEPLKKLVKAQSKEEWLDRFIGKWSAFVKDGEAKYHFVGGTHRNMISEPNLEEFLETFKKVLKERGVV